MGALQPMHLVVILVIVLIVFGPGKLTELGGQLGKGVREFREVSEGDTGSATADQPTGSQYCTQCGAAIAGEAAFCSSCGAGVA